MKKTVTLILLALLAVCLASPVLALLSQGEDFYVTDETGSLSPDTVEQLVELNRDLEESCGGAQFVVAFVDYFGDMYADEYTVALFNAWSLSPRAMLLCVSPTEGRGGLTVGTDLEDVFTEKDMNNYLERYFWDDFDAGKYDKAVLRLAEKVEDWFKDRYYTGGGSPSVSAPTSSGSGWLAGLGFLGVILGFLFRNIFIILVFVLIVLLVIQADRRRYRGYYTSMGMPIPRYYPWYIFTSRPYRRYRPPQPPPGSRPRGPGYRPPTPPRSPRPPRSSGSGSFGGRSGRPSGGYRPSGGSRPSGGGRSGGSFGGRR